jgi:hypothetical protein
MENELVKNFKCDDKMHVKWLQYMSTTLMKKMSDGKKFDLEYEINSNPTGVKMARDKMLDWAEIHFMLSMKYSTAVLSGEAWIPPQKSDTPLE